MGIWNVFWRDTTRRTHYGFIKARTRDEAYDFATKKLRPGTVVTAIYRASEGAITPQSICLNFANTTDYMYPYN